MSKEKSTKRADQYDDGDYNYQDYWKGRDYEHAAEELAISRLLKGMYFKHAVDVGGGYGRLSKYLTKYADNVLLAEPSKQQLELAKNYLKNTKQVTQKCLQAADLGLPDASVDLVMVVRVLHHLPDPASEFSEIARVLQKDGVFLMEFANNAHFLNRVRYTMRGKRIPLEPVDIRSAEHRNETEIPFVNHHPKTVIKQLNAAGFEVERVLSGSNLRSPSLKRMLPKTAMTKIESLMQPMLAPFYFGPSVWLLMRKK
jgi:SAM-dependent methyltransferase